MSYIPKSIAIFTAAFNGALSGMVANRGITDPSPTSQFYTDMAEVAEAYAQEFDTNYIGASNTLTLGLIVEISQSVWYDRVPDVNVPANLLPATYAELANAVIGMVGAAALNYAANGIIPGTTPGGDPASIAQGVWFVDPVNGNDANTGLTSGTAIKTLAQLSARWGVGSFLPGVLSTVITPIQLITVNLMGDIPASDPLSVDLELPPNGLLAFCGTMTAVRTGVLSAVTVKNRNTNTTWGISDGVAFTAADIGKRVRITSGPNAGQFAWVTKDLGASPNLGTAATYGVLGASAVTNTGGSVVTGDVGVFPTASVTGFPPGTASSIHIADAAAQQAQTDALALYTALAAHSAVSLSASSFILDGVTLGPGYYSIGSSATLAETGNATLTLNGSATDIFVIKTGSTLRTGAGGIPTIALTGGAVAANVFWLVGSSATINIGVTSATATFKGTIIAQASVTDTQGATVNGRLIALTGAVTLSAAANITAPAAVPSATSVRCTSFSAVTLPGVGTGTPDSLIQTGVTTGVVAVGDPYVLETMSKITVRRCTVYGNLSGGNTSPTVGFANVDRQSAGGGPNLSVPTIGSIQEISKGCRYSSQISVSFDTGTRPQYLNCWINGSPSTNAVRQQRTGPVFRSGGCFGSFNIQVGLTIVDDDYLIQGPGFLDVLASGGYLGTIAVFDSPTDGVRIGVDGWPSVCSDVTNLAGTHLIWGSGNAGFGIKLSGGSQFMFGTNIPTITGTAGDFAMNSSGLATASPWDPAQNAGAGAYLVPVATTWANMAAALPGGFGGNGAHNLINNSHLSKM